MREIQKFKLTVTIFLFLALGLGSVYGEDLSEEQLRRLDSIEVNLDDMESKVRSTLMFGGSSPVSFSGEARVRLQWHNFSVYPEFLSDDRSYLQSGWDGNENMVRVGMVARPGRNTVIWAKIGFQHTMPGNRYITRERDGTYEAQTRHDKTNATVTIHEDMNAGIALRTVPASFWLKMGNIHWTEASPLTVWKSQPRTFGWEYLPFEVEQPIARYYEYNIAKGEKTGRAAWNKKPFNGINLESISLPANLYLNFIYGTFERFDNFEREYLDFSNDIAYAGDGGAIKARGVGDSYRKVLHGRFAAKKFYKDLPLGFNATAIDYNEDFIYANGFSDKNQFNMAFDIKKNGSGVEYKTIQTESGTDSILVSLGRGFYKEPKNLSLDLRGPINEAFSIHSDIAVGWIDTTWLIADSALTPDKAMKIKDRIFSSSDISPAVYTTVDWNGPVPMSADMAYIGPGYYAPFSFAAPVDAFYAFGTNMLGAGKFIGRGEGSPYVQNMAGLLLTVEPKLPGYGHLRIKYGQHFQIESARDLLYMPYRLNGADFSSIPHSSYMRWGNGELDHPLSGKYDARLGDESFQYPQHYDSPDGPASGGLITDYLSTYEAFVAYPDSLSAALNYESKSSTTSREASTGDTTSKTAFVPHNQKFTFNLETDVGYDIGPLVGYSKDLFVGGYASVSGVSTTFKPLAINDTKEDVLLWSLYLRFEPAIAITERLYAIGLLGFENWRSQKAYMPVDGGGVKNVPIDYRDVAYGLGLDWDMLERVGLHLRAKYMKHTDVNYSKNDWETPVVSAEMKMWF